MPYRELNATHLFVDSMEAARRKRQDAPGPPAPEPVRKPVELGDVRPGSHVPRDFNALKVEDSTRPAPEQPRKPESFLPPSDKTMTTEQVMGFNKAAGLWTNDQANEYQRQQAALRPAQQNYMNAKETEKAREYVFEQRAQAMGPKEIEARYIAAGRQQDAERFAKHRSSFRDFDDQTGARAHRLEHARTVLKIEAKNERLATIERGQSLESDRKHEHSKGR